MLMKLWLLLGLLPLVLLASCTSAGGAKEKGTMMTTGRPLKVICLGDSITGNSDLRHYLKFSHVLDLMLDARRGRGSTLVLNRGIGGNTTADVLKRLDPEVLREKPDIVVLLISGNDAGNKSQDRAVTRANLEQIVGRIKQGGAKVLMLQYHLVPNPEHPETAWTHLVNNNYLIAAVAARQEAPVLDMGPPFATAAKTARIGELASDVDGVHLNPGGELIYAREIFYKLDQLGWIK